MSKKNSFTSCIITTLLTIHIPLLNAQQPYSSDALYHQLTKEYTLYPDGSTVFRYIKILELISYRSFHNLYGETFIQYNPNFQKLIINDSYTVMADGKKIKTPENAFNEVLPFCATNTPAYNGLREMIITHTALERGAKIYLDYEIHSKNTLIPGLRETEILAETEPVKELTIIIKIPKGHSFFYKLIPDMKSPEQSSDGFFDIYTWKFNDLPVITPEDFQIAGQRGYPYIQFCSDSNPREVLRKIYSQEAFHVELNPEIIREISRMNENEKDPLQLTLKMHEMVVNDLRLYPIPYKVTGGQCRTPNETWNSNGGTNLEKAILLASMLQKSNIPAYPIAIAFKDSRDNPEQSGQYDDINDFAVLAKPENHSFFILSVTHLNNQDLNLNKSYRKFYVLDSEKRPFTWCNQALSGSISVTGTFLVSTDPQLTGELLIETEGACNPFLALTRDQNAIKKTMGGGLSSTDLKELKSSRPSLNQTEQTWIVQSNQIFRKDSLFIFFEFPFLKEGIDGWNIKTLSSQRLTPFEIPFTIKEEYEFSLALPPSIRILIPSKKVEISNSAGVFNLEVKEVDGKIMIQRKIELRKGVYSETAQLSEYLEFKRLVDAWNNPHNREIVLISAP
jgi:hypothetical protein